PSRVVSPFPTRRSSDLLLLFSMNCYFKKYTLHFKRPGGTSRGVLHDKDTYFLFLEQDGCVAIGECNRFVNLSYDDREGYEEKLRSEEHTSELQSRENLV